MKILISNTITKSILYTLFIFITGVFIPRNLYATEVVDVYFFWGQGCPHCAKEKEFLDKLIIEDNSINIKYLEVWNNADNRQILIELGKKLNADISGVPFLVIGDEYIVGFLSEETTGAQIRSLINQEKTKLGITALPNEEVQKKTPIKTVAKEIDVQKNHPNLPNVANINLNSLSLPALTIAMGFLDGFNPCAMWTLLFLISLLIGLNDKKKMWMLGLAFIVTSASVYLLFMLAWLQLFLYIGYILWIRLVIALIALIGGSINLKKFLSKDSSGCEVVGETKRKSIFDKLGSITSNKSFLLSLIGIVGLAFAVNLVELICSAGLPAVYTQVLALNNLNSSQYYGYILLYILFFMLDDLFVFFVAMLTLQMTGITTKYVKYSRLIGGLMMLAIGLLLLIKPELLMFG